MKKLFLILAAVALTFTLAACKTDDPEVVNVLPTISGTDVVNIRVGDAFDPLSGVSATDEEDLDLSIKINEKLPEKLADLDIEDLKDWGEKMKIANRCGLGQTAAAPILTTIENFREKYEKLVKKDVDFESGFDLAKAVAASCEYVDRVPNL